MANDSLEVYGRLVSPGSGSATKPITLDDLQGLFMSQKLPPYADEVRRGTGWATMSTAAVAALVVRPSTTAAFEIFNGYPGGGKSLIIDRVFFFNLVSTNAIEGFSGWAMVTTAKAAVTTGAFAVTSAYGNKNYAGPVIAAASTTVVANGWYPWGNAYQKGAGGVVPFGAISADVQGLLIVPPQCSLCLHVVASLVGDTFTQGASWYEEQIALE
jgi:hypothetical protein